MTEIQDINIPELNMYTGVSESQLLHYFEPLPVYPWEQCSRFPGL